MSAVYFQLPREAQAWVRELVARRRLSSDDAVMDAIAEAVQYGAGRPLDETQPEPQAALKVAFERQGS